MKKKIEKLPKHNREKEKKIREKNVKDTYVSHYKKKNGSCVDRFPSFWKAHPKF